MTKRLLLVSALFLALAISLEAHACQVRFQSLEKTLSRFELIIEAVVQRLEGEPGVFGNHTYELSTLRAFLGDSKMAPSKIGWRDRRYAFTANGLTECLSADLESGKEGSMKNDERYILFFDRRSDSKLVFSRVEETSVLPMLIRSLNSGVEGSPYERPDTPLTP